MTLIEELKNSFLVYEQGMTLEDAADCYDEMNDGEEYRRAVVEYRLTNPEVGTIL